MNPTDARKAIALALDEAEVWFRIQRETDVPSLEPEDSSWTKLNKLLPDNAPSQTDGMTELDRLFEITYRHHMAYRWISETSHPDFAEGWGHALAQMDDENLALALEGWKL